MAYYHNPTYLSLLSIIFLSVFFVDPATSASKGAIDYEYYVVDCDFEYEKKMDTNCDFMWNSLYDINIPNGRPKKYKGPLYTPLQFAKLVENKTITEKDLDVFFPFWNIQRYELQETVNEVCKGLIGMTGVREGCCSSLKVLCGYYDYEDNVDSGAPQPNKDGTTTNKPTTTTTTTTEGPLKGRPLTQFFQSIFGKIFT